MNVKACAAALLLVVTVASLHSADSAEDKAMEAKMGCILIRTGFDANAPVTTIGRGSDPKKVTDAGLANLKTFPEVKNIDLHETPITDKGLEHMKGLTHLESLTLDRTAITDKGL